MEWIIHFCLASTCYSLYKIIVGFNEANHRKLNNIKRNILGWFIVLSVFGSYYTYTYYHDELTRIKDGEIYYVNLFEKEDAQKNYRVPGMIYANEDGYKLSHVYWSNGGELTFYDSYSDLIIGEKISIQDDTDKEWFVELTREKAEIKK